MVACKAQIEIPYMIVAAAGTPVLVICAITLALRRPVSNRWHIRVRVAEYCHAVLLDLGSQRYRFFPQ